MAYVNAYAYGFEADVVSREDLQEELHKWNEEAREVWEEEGNNPEDFSLVDEEDLTLKLEDAYFNFIDGEEVELSEIEEAVDAADDLYRLSDSEEAALYYLMDTIRYPFLDAVSRVDNVIMFRGDVEEAAQEMEIDTHIPDHLESYIDWAAYGRDKEYSGEWYEFLYGGNTWVVLNNSRA